MNYLGNSFGYLLDLVIRLFALLLLLRVWIQLSRVDFYHQLVQFIRKLTDPIITPLRAVVPKIYSLDLASCLVLLVLGVIRAMLVTVPTSEGSLAAWLALALALTLQQLSGLMMFTVIVGALLSWVQPYGPLAVFLAALNHGLLEPVRKRLGTISGIDLSPLVVIVLIGFLSRLIVRPLLDYGLGVL